MIGMHASAYGNNLFILYSEQKCISSPLNGSLYHLNTVLKYIIGRKNYYVYSVVLNLHRYV